MFGKHLVRWLNGRLVTVLVSLWVYISTLLVKCWRRRGGRGSVSGWCENVLIWTRLVNIHSQDLKGTSSRRHGGLLTMWPVVPGPFHIGVTEHPPLLTVPVFILCPRKKIHDTKNYILNKNRQRLKVPSSRWSRHPAGPLRRHHDLTCGLSGGLVKVC